MPASADYSDFDDEDLDYCEAYDDIYGEEEYCGCSCPDCIGEDAFDYLDYGDDDCLDDGDEGLGYDDYDDEEE